MQVQFWMTPDPRVVDVDASVEQARSILRELDVRHMPIVRSGRLVGIVSDRDLADASDQILHHPVGSVMSSPPLTVSPDDEIVDAARLMLSHKVSALPVVTDDGTLLGIVTTTNCLVALIQLHHELTINPGLDLRGADARTGSDDDDAGVPSSSAG